MRGFCAFLIPGIAEATPEQAQHKCSGGGVKAVFRKHYKPRVQHHHSADEKGKETLCYPFLHSFSLWPVPVGLEAAHLSMDPLTTAALPCSPAGPGAFLRVHRGSSSEQMLCPDSYRTGSAFPTVSGRSFPSAVVCDPLLIELHTHGRPDLCCSLSPEAWKLLACS